MCGIQREADLIFNLLSIIYILIVKHLQDVIAEVLDQEYPEQVPYSFDTDGFKPFV